MKDTLLELDMNFKDGIKCKCVCWSIVFVGSAFIGESLARNRKLINLNRKNGFS